MVGSDCLAGKAYANISRRIIGEEVPFLDLEVKQGVFGKLMDLFKKTKGGRSHMGLMDLFKKKSSGDVAKDRLKLLLVSDRANCSPEMMEMIKRDIIQVISKYMDIDADALDVKITETESDSNNGMVPALFANIPIKDMKHKPDKR